MKGIDKIISISVAPLPEVGIGLIHNEKTSKSISHLLEKISLPNILIVGFKLRIRTSENRLN
jgi:hypothetical protein